MKKLAIGILSAAFASSALTGCGGGGSSAMMPTTGSPVTAPTQTTAPGQSAPQQRTTAAFTITVPKAGAAQAGSRHSMYVSPNTESVRVAATQVDGKAPNVPDSVIALTKSTPGCAADTTGALKCTLNVAAPVGKNVTFQISTYASTDGSGAVLAQATLSAAIAANASNPISVSLGGVVSKIAFSPANISVFADGAGHRYFITVNALDASGATIVGTARYQSPISLGVQNDPAGALGLSSATLATPGSSFYLTYDSSKYVDGATVVATDGTNPDGSAVTGQMALDPLSFSQTTTNGTYGLKQGTPYVLTLHEKNFTGPYTYTLTDPDVESVSISTPDSNGNAFVTITPSSTNSGYSLMTVNDGQVQMPIGTQVLPSAANVPSITVQNLTSVFSGETHYAPYRLLSGPLGSTDLWFAATEDGVIGKYDVSTHGETLYPDTVANIPIPEYMLWGPDGKIWYADGNPSTPSIASFDPVSHQFAHYYQNLQLPSFPFDVIIGPDGKLWYGDQGPGAAGIGTFDMANPNAGVTEYTAGMASPVSRPISLTVGPDNNIWFADQVYGAGSNVVGAVGEFNMATHTSTEYNTGLPSGLTDEEDGPAGIVSDGQKLWFIGRGLTGYVGSIDPVTKQIQLYTAGFQMNEIPTHLLISKDHTTLWFITEGSDPLRGLLYGLAKFDIASKRVTEYRTGFDPTIPHEPADLKYGPDGNIYFAESVYLRPGIGKMVCGPSVGC